MDWVQLLERIERWEDSLTELKEESVHPDDLAAGIVALANTRGGEMILGVSDRREVVGVTDPDRLAQRIDRVCYQNIEPPLYCTMEKVSGQVKVRERRKKETKLVLIVHVPRGPERPYRTNKGVFYIRTASSRTKASRGQLLGLYQATFSIYPDELPVVGTHLTDLDMDYFEQFFEKFYGVRVDDTGQDRNRLLGNLKLLTQDGLTVAGLLAFGKTPQRYLPFAKISAVRFDGVEVGEKITDRKDIEGTLEKQIDGVQTFLNLHLAQAAEIRGFKREDKPLLPVEAQREAVVNAVAHRDYTLRSQIRIFIFDDRMEVSSPGRLLNTVTVESMRLGVHAERNPIIVTLLTKLGFMSQIGTGVPRMIRLMKEYGLPEPGITGLENEVKVILKFHEES